VIPLGDNAFLVSADLGIRDWADFFPVVLESPRMDTVGGFVISLCKRWPHPGDAVEYRGLRFTVEKMQGLRLEQIRVEAVQAGAAAGPGALHA
jgi:CBS domain containing-hemolysin-like protein